MKQILKLTGCIVILIHLGCANKSQENSINQVSVTQNEYTETEDIFNYKYGTTERLRKRMFLSEIARHYSIESDYAIDTIVPVILVSSEDTYACFEVYSISRTDPWALDVTDVTNIELFGRYIVAYSLPNEDTLSAQEIKQKGVNTSCPYLRLHETSWFVFLSPNMHKYIIVKDVFSKEEACVALEDCVGGTGGID